MEMVKNVDIVPAFILKVIYLANSEPESWPQYYCRLCTAIWPAPELFLVSIFFTLTEMAKSTEIIPVFILQVIYVAEPEPEYRPQYSSWSGTAIRQAPELFLGPDYFLN